MQGVLIDTSTLLDLVLSLQNEQETAFRRPFLRSTTSAIEAFVIYDSVFVDGPSFNGFAGGTRITNYLRHSRQDLETTFERLADLKVFCHPIELTDDQINSIYAKVADVLEEHLLNTNNVSQDGRSFYQYLPYHLGDDTTNIECRVDGAPSSDLRHVTASVSPEVSNRILNILRDRNHPVRAAFALPVIRSLYYLILHQSHSLHFVPHETKAEIISQIGTEEPVAKRLVDYFDNKVRTAYLKRKTEVLGQSDISIPIPLVSNYILKDVTDWDRIVDRIEEVRSSKEAKRYRQAISYLCSLLEQKNSVEVDSIMNEIIAAADSWSNNLALVSKKQKITITIPFINVSTDFEVPYRQFPRGTAGEMLIFIHRLLSSV